jgi:hypothetical protein
MLPSEDADIPKAERVQRRSRITATWPMTWIRRTGRALAVLGGLIAVLAQPFSTATWSWQTLGILVIGLGIVIDVGIPGALEAMGHPWAAPAAIAVLPASEPIGAYPGVGRTCRTRLREHVAIPAPSRDSTTDPRCNIVRRSGSIHCHRTRRPPALTCGPPVRYTGKTRHTVREGDGGACRLSAVNCRRTERVD